MKRSKGTPRCSRCRCTNVALRRRPAEVEGSAGAGDSTPAGRNHGAGSLKPTLPQREAEVRSPEL